MKILKIFFFVIAIKFAIFGQGASVEWSPEMQMKVKAIGAPRVSPDGSHVVYTVVNEVMTADKSEFVTDLARDGRR